MNTDKIDPERVVRQSMLQGFLAILHLSARLTAIPHITLTAVQLYKMLCYSVADQYCSASEHIISNYFCFPFNLVACAHYWDERPSISTLPVYCADMHVQHPQFQLVHKVIGW
jgi:hypothetical protein